MRLLHKTGVLSQLPAFDSMRKTWSFRSTFGVISIGMEMRRSRMLSRSYRRFESSHVIAEWLVHGRTQRTGHRQVATRCIKSSKQNSPSSEIRALVLGETLSNESAQHAINCAALPGTGLDAGANPMRNPASSTRCVRCNPHHARPEKQAHLVPASGLPPWQAKKSREQLAVQSEL